MAKIVLKRPPKLEKRSLNELRIAHLKFTYRKKTYRMKNEAQLGFFNVSSLPEKSSSRTRLSLKWSSLFYSQHRLSAFQIVSIPEKSRRQIPYSTELLLEDEYRSLEFFQIHTTFCFGSRIGSYLFRAVYHEPILKTITVALGSLHQSFAHSPAESLDPQERTRFTLLRYNKAIRQLVSIDPLTNPQSNDTFLIACILFFFFALNVFKGIINWRFSMPYPDSGSSNKKN